MQAGRGGVGQGRRVQAERRQSGADNAPAVPLRRSARSAPPRRPGGAPGDGRHEFVTDQQAREVVGQHRHRQPAGQIHRAHGEEVPHQVAGAALAREGQCLQECAARTPPRLAVDSPASAGAALHQAAEDRMLLQVRVEFAGHVGREQDDPAVPDQHPLGVRSRQDEADDRRLPARRPDSAGRRAPNTCVSSPRITSGNVVRQVRAGCPGTSISSRPQAVATGVIRAARSAALAGQST